VVPKYEVISPLRHNGKDYEPGKMVEMSEDEAAACPALKKPDKEKK
jgi:hypothetical protein